MVFFPASAYLNIFQICVTGLVKSEQLKWRNLQREKWLIVGLRLA